MATRIERPTLDQAEAILRLIRKKETPQEQITRLLSSGYLPDLLDADLDKAVDRDTFRKGLGLRPLWIVRALKVVKGSSIATFPVVLNYDESLKAKTASGFDYVSSNITDKNFPKSFGSGRVETEAILVNFGEYVVKSNDAVANLNKIGLRPGVLKELADLSKSYPDSAELPAHFPIAALGDSWQDSAGGSRHVAYLYGNVSSHELSFNWLDDRWHSRWWFLAFRK